MLQEYEWVMERAPDMAARANRRSVGDLYMGRLQYAQALAAYLQHELF